MFIIKFVLAYVFMVYVRISEYQVYCVFELLKQIYVFYKQLYSRSLLLLMKTCRSKCPNVTDSLNKQNINATKTTSYMYTYVHINIASNDKINALCIYVYFLSVTQLL